MDKTQAPPVEPDDAPEGLALATFAAGCFWGVEEFFLAIPGVVDAVSGYTGGARPAADLRAGVLGGDRTRRGRPRHLRPDQGVLRAPPRGVLASPRPHDAQPTGPRRRHPVPLGGLRPRRRAGAPRQGVAGAIPGPVPAPDRHRGDRRPRRSGRPRRTTSATWSAPGTGRATSPTGSRSGAPGAPAVGGPDRGAARGRYATAVPRFYVTTPIYYVNDAPHVGHAYTTVNADALARWHRLLGDDVFFLTGTDEHGDKIARAAEAHGVSPQEWVDSTSRRFVEAWDGARHLQRRLHPHHRAPPPPAPSSEFLQKIHDNGFIELGIYSGLYCVSCEDYKKESELVDGNCADPRHAGRAARGGELLLQAERVRGPAPRVVRGQSRRRRARRRSATRRSASSRAASRTSRSPGPPLDGGSRCRGTRPTSSTSGTTR